MPELRFWRQFFQKALGDYRLKRPTVTPGLCLCGHLADCLSFLGHASRSVCVAVLISAFTRKLMTNPQSASPRMRDPKGPKKLVNPRKSRTLVRSFLSAVPTPVKLSMVS